MNKIVISDKSRRRLIAVGKKNPHILLAHKLFTHCINTEWRLAAWLRVCEAIDSEGAAVLSDMTGITDPYDHDRRALASFCRYAAQGAGDQDRRNFDVKLLKTQGLGIRHGQPGPPHIRYVFTAKGKALWKLMKD